MNIRDEQATNTTMPGEHIPAITITSPAEQEVQGEVGFPPGASMTQSRGLINGYEEPGGYVPDWKEYQGGYDRRIPVRAAVFGGLSGGVFFLPAVVIVLFTTVFAIVFASVLIGALLS